MLSGECAAGKYPVECVEDMVKISDAVEGDLNYWKRFSAKPYSAHKDSLKANVAYISCVAARDSHADAIVAYTHTGETAYQVSSFRPACPILVVTDDLKTYHKLSLVQNVTPLFIDGKDSLNETIAAGITKFENDGILEKGDKIVICGGSKILPIQKESQVIGGLMRI